jgi:nucleoside-diphosphate-sugar epimerase
MKVLVTGSSGYLGHALVEVLRAEGFHVVGLDIVDSPSTTVLGSILDRHCVRRCARGLDAIVHTATLHKPHVGFRSRRDFVDTNVTGTLTLLEEAVSAGVGRFLFTSTTSTFGRALTPPAGAPAAWITEEVRDVPKNIYGVTKATAEALCEIVHRDHGLPCVILRTSRFFPERDDSDEPRYGYLDSNVKVNELLYRRIDLADAVEAHRLALGRAPALGFARYVISANTPFGRGDLAALRADAPAVVRRLFPRYPSLYLSLGWKMFPSIDRVYVSERACRELGWSPRYNFAHALDRLSAGEDPRSPLAVGLAARHLHSATAEPHALRRSAGPREQLRPSHVHGEAR